MKGFDLLKMMEEKGLVRISEKRKRGVWNKEALEKAGLSITFMNRINNLARKTPILGKEFDLFVEILGVDRLELQAYLMWLNDMKEKRDFLRRRKISFTFDPLNDWHGTYLAELKGENLKESKLIK